MAPEPLIGDDVDLRDFQFMPLDVVRLWDSDLAGVSSGDEFRAAVLLWCKAWHQQPAGSLPDDDRQLARYAGYGRDVDGWAGVREGALRGFEKCTDGRFYHPVICEKASEAWAGKQRQRDRTRKATASRRKSIERHDNRNDERNVERDDIRDVIVTNDTPDRNDERDVDRNGIRDDGPHVQRYVHQGTGTGIETGKEGKQDLSVDVPSTDTQPVKKLKKRDDGMEAEFEVWWQHVPKKVGKLEALKAYRKARKSASAAELLAGVQAYAKSVEGKEPDFVKHPGPWLNAGRWMDQAVGRPPEYTDDQWRRRCDWFKNGGFPPELQRSDKVKFAKFEWDTAKDGPPPGQPGCHVPKEILTEMGFET